MATDNSFLSEFSKATLEQKKSDKKLPANELISRMFTTSHFYPGAIFKIIGATYYCRETNEGDKPAPHFYVFETTIGDLWCSMITKIRVDAKTGDVVTASGTFDNDYRNLVNDIISKGKNPIEAHEKFAEKLKNKLLQVTRKPIFTLGDDGNYKTSTYVEINYKD